ncbi:MAG: amidohydrolase family protein [Ruminococcaceae bacterium]|nr:amidohydrolase family protein [Oscillospiraceae bacterium]
MLDFFCNRMDLFYNNPVVNWHEHVREIRPEVLDTVAADRLVQAAQKLGMYKLLVSRPISADRFCPPEDFRQANDIVAAAVARHPDVLRGMCFVNPGFQKEAIAEIRRCVHELHMVGVKLYHQYFIHDPVLFPLIEACIELDIPILMHAGKLCVDPLSQPHLSNGIHFAAAARRYPEAHFIMAHIGGGGDWSWSLKAIAPYRNIVADISGSVIDRPMIEQSVAALGADRLLFGTDGSISAGIGKLLGADIPENDKKTILAGENYRRFLERGEAR